VLFGVISLGFPLTVLTPVPAAASFAPTLLGVIVNDAEPVPVALTASAKGQGVC
jgi:hypothetical protein